jgi:hypothetical protein
VPAICERGRGQRSPGLAAIVGLAGGLAGGLAMNLYSRAVVATAGGEAPDAAPGADRVGRGMQPPQSRGRADDDAAVRTGAAAVRVITGHEPDRQTRLAAGVAAHYAFAATAGAIYGCLASRVGIVSAARGALYGAAVWVIADEMVTPALGLARPRRIQSRTLQAYSLIGHILYGAVLEAIVNARPGARSVTHNAGMGRVPRLSGNSAPRET